MRDYDPRLPLISLHIPKTAGTSLEQVLREWFRENLYTHYFDEHNNRMPARRVPGPGICIHGHFNRRRGFGIRDYYPDVRQFVSIFRDPFDILVSRYFDVKKRESKNRAFRDGKRLVLPGDAETYLQREILKPDYHPNILDYLPGPVTMDDYRDIIEENFIYIGILEDFQFSVDTLARKIGKPAVPLRYLNESRRFQEFSPGLRTRFMETHPLEYAVYGYVLTHYRTMWT